jgi:hypothetical protein
MTADVPRRDGSQILRASLVFVTQFTIASNGRRDANCITPLRIAHPAVGERIAGRGERNSVGWLNASR